MMNPVEGAADASLCDFSDPWVTLLFLPHFACSLCISLRTWHFSPFFPFTQSVHLTAICPRATAHPQGVSAATSL